MLVPDGFAFPREEKEHLLDVRKTLHGRHAVECMLLVDPTSKLEELCGRPCLKMSEPAARQREVVKAVDGLLFADEGQPVDVSEIARRCRAVDQVEYIFYDTLWNLVLCKPAKPFIHPASKQSDIQ